MVPVARTLLSFEPRSSALVLMVILQMQMFALWLADAAAIAFTRMSDNRCFDPNFISLSTAVVTTNRDCARLCNGNPACGAFMVSTSNNLCTLYPSVRQNMYSALTVIAPGQCNIFTSGWAATCPTSSWSFNGTSFYAYPTVDAIQSALSVCLANGQLLYTMKTPQELAYVQATFVSDWYWISLYGPSAGPTFTWLTNNATVLKTTVELSGTSWYNDNCCGTDILCYATKANYITDNGCTNAYASLPLCTCS